jgi:hypothetical protein
LTTVAYELGDCLLWAFLKKMQKLPIFELFTQNGSVYIGAISLQTHMVTLFKSEANKHD